MRVLRVSREEMMHQLARFGHQVPDKEMVDSFVRPLKVTQRDTCFVTVNEEDIVMAWAILGPLGDDELEYYSGVFPEFRGKGLYYVQRAAAVSYGFENLGAEYVWSSVLDSNVKFQTKRREMAAEGKDWRWSGRLTYPGREQDIFMVSKHEWYDKWIPRHGALPVEDDSGTTYIE